MNKPIVLYDGACYLCNQSKRFFQKLDWMAKMEWISLQEYEKFTDLSDYQRKAINQELHVRFPTGYEMKGYDAVTYLMRKCPLTFILGLIFSIPGSGMIGKPLYSLVARNRYKLFKNKCKNGTCTLSKP
ncbi:thiol-disulfide oxidoreductase DCC family protein [Halobacillus sp. BBL2006]|uniref:thiol-disulfide oxidoreductase DCC family protein n=1 Tax=Halobacillus sp. BBL2006 TaxID=1543706 RepID=UPI000542EEA3|nr:DUF393 domain-containing protein [Halobacillus sp. BBL2006]KHE67058.1 hypothetical protein LD39_19520 [Halobacillus sp. BBL2006]